MKRFILASLFLLGLCWQADAASCFWVGGTGTWDTTNTGGGGTGGIKWATTTGGSTTCAATGNVPNNAGDSPQFDANSGGGTVTVNTNAITTGSLALTGYTGTLDFSANNNNISLSSISDTSGTHTLNMGSGTWTLTSSATTGTIVTLANASLTLNAGTSTLAISSTGACTAGSLLFNFGSKTLATVTMASTAGACVIVTNGTNTYGHLTLTGPVAVQFPQSVTTTISNAYTWTGSSGSNIFLYSGTAGIAATISTPAGSTASWVGIRDMTFSSNTPTFSNCLNLGHTSGVTCSAPVTVIGTRGVIGG